MPFDNPLQAFGNYIKPLQVFLKSTLFYWKFYYLILFNSDFNSIINELYKDLIHASEVNGITLSKFINTKHIEYKIISSLISRKINSLEELISNTVTFIAPRLFGFLISNFKIFPIQCNQFVAIDIIHHKT